MSVEIRNIQWRGQRKMFGPASSAAGARVVGGGVRGNPPPENFEN